MHQRLLDYVDRISNILGRSCKFGIYDEDDIGQEIFLLVHAGQKFYDPQKGDEFSFYFHFVRNRLRTLKRDKYFNPALLDPEGMRKFNNPGQLEENTKSYINKDLETVDRADLLLDVVGTKIPANLRINYLKMLEGIELPYHEKTKLIGIVKNIVGANSGGKK